MRKALLNSPETGFTIIELLIATLVFSIVLVAIVSAFIQISRIFYKGVNMSNTRDDTSTAMIDIANDIQFSASTLSISTFSVDSSSSPNSFCVGNHRYAIYAGQQVGGSAPLAGIYRENVSSPTNCPPLTTQNGITGVSVTPSTADQLLGSGMQINYLSVDCSNGVTCQLQAHVVFYGGSQAGLFSSVKDSDPATAYQATDAECTGALTSSQFCASIDYNRTILQGT